MKRITAYVLALVLTCFCVSSVAGAYYADVPGSSRAGRRSGKGRALWPDEWVQPSAIRLFRHHDPRTVSCCADPHVGMQTPSTEEADADITPAMALPEELSSQYRYAIACAAAMM